MSDMPFPYFMINNVLWFVNEWIVDKEIQKIILKVVGKGRKDDK